MGTLFNCSGGQVFARVKPVQAALADLDRIESLVRDRFALGEDQIVLISQEQLRQPGVPPVATTILFWDDAGQRHRLRLFAPCAEVRADDLPPPWLRLALRDDGVADCC